MQATASTAAATLPSTPPAHAAAATTQSAAVPAAATTGAVAPSQPSQPSQRSPAPADATPRAAAGTHATQDAQSADGINFPLRPATTASTQGASPAVGHASAADAGSIGGALFSLVLVVGLILVLGWLARRMPGMQRGAAASSLKVVASVSLGPRERAVVVDVGGTQLLVGVGQGGVRTLHRLDSPLPAPATTSTPSPFAQVLAQHFGRKP